MPSLKMYVMHKSNIIKVRLQTIEMAEKIKAEGLSLFYFSIPPRNIEPERYTNIPQCKACYSYKHVKKDCPQKEQKICSECAKPGHTYKEYSNKDQLKCINCGKNHRTLVNAKYERRQSQPSIRRRLNKFNISNDPIAK